MVSFGGYNGAIAVLSQAFEALPLLLLGRLVSPNATALFNRTMMIATIPDKLVLAGVTSVVLPAFAAETREGGDLKKPYLTALSYITALHWPALLLIVVLAFPAVEIVLGPQWIEAVPLVQIVAIAFLFSFSFELNYPVLVAMGAIRDLFIRALIIFPASGLIMCAAIYLGGLRAVAASLLFTIPFQAWVSLSFVKRRLGLSWWDIALALWKSAAVALITIGPVLAAILFLGSGFAISPLLGIAAGLLAGVSWGVALVLTRHPLFDEIAKTFPLIRKTTLHPAE